VTESVDAFLAGEKLGPDALDPHFDAEAFSAALGKGKSIVKAALMDQSRIAGIGNTYADEILFQARLHPGVSLNALDSSMRRLLFDAVKHVLRTAVECGAGAEDFTDRLPKGFLLPERHTGGHCPRCGSALTIDKRGGRTSYHCPKCQREARG
jgi:formamidopyrimidine-DNA glycosylase